MKYSAPMICFFYQLCSLFRHMHVCMYMLYIHVPNVHLICFIGATSFVFKNISSSRYGNFIRCSFLNNQSFYCVVCCSTDPSVPPDSSVYNISTTSGTEVTVSLQGLTSGQMYYCNAAATNTNSTRCAGLVVGGVKMYFSFVASLPPTTFATTCRCIHVYMIEP